MTQEEKIARERVEKSPLGKREEVRGFTIGHFSGNHAKRTVNNLPKTEQAQYVRRRGTPNVDES